MDKLINQSFLKAIAKSPLTGEIALPEYRVESCAVEHPEDIKHEWIDLQKRADCSYFQSWGWVGVWLKQIASELDPVLVKVWFGDVLVGMGLFVSRQVIRHRIFHSNAMFLNEYPFDGRNMVIEYNGLLTDKEHEQVVYREAIKHLLETHQNSEEFLFSGLCESKDSKFLQDGNDDSKSNLKVLEKSLTWSVGLDVFDQGADAFLETLSKNRRAQIRRSIKAYEERAPLVLEEACNAQQALTFFDGLKELHTARWKLKGGDGSFANPLWENFHRVLINSRFEEGEIQLLRVSNNGVAIGYLYNFIWRKHVYVLQTGFNIAEDKRIMPGYVVHVLAIAYNKKNGMEIYDLMHGDSLYKRILCDRSEALYWLVIQRKEFKFFVEDCARELVRHFRGRKQ